VTALHSNAISFFKYWVAVVRDSVKLWLDRNAFSYTG